MPRAVITSPYALVKILVHPHQPTWSIGLADSKATPARRLVNPYQLIEFSPNIILGWVDRYRRSKLTVIALDK